jgi:hypothetical protein
MLFLFLSKKYHITFDKLWTSLYIRMPLQTGVIVEVCDDERRGNTVTKIFFSIITVLVLLVILVGGALGIFLVPFFQADEMLAQIRVEEVVNNQCYLISLELTPENDESRRQVVLSHKPICGDFLGIGYEFALPDKTFALLKKPGIVITNVVAFEKKTRNQTGNIQVGSYKIELVESIRERIAQLLKEISVFKSITYDIKAWMKKPKKGALISYKLEPFRQQVVVECTGCEE